MAKVGMQSLVTVLATLNGQAGDIEKLNSVKLSQPDVGLVSIDPEGKSATIDWVVAATGVIVSVDADGVIGADNSIKADSEPFDVLPAETVLADTITVVVADKPAA